MMFLFFYFIKLFFLFLSFLFIVWDFIVIFKSWIAISFIFNLLLHVFNPKYYFFLQSSRFDADLVYHFTSILWSPHFFLYWDKSHYMLPRLVWKSWDSHYHPDSISHTIFFNSWNFQSFSFNTAFPPFPLSVFGVQWGKSWRVSSLHSTLALLSCFTSPSPCCPSELECVTSLFVRV